MGNFVGNCVHVVVPFEERPREGSGKHGGTKEVENGAGTKGGKQPVIKGELDAANEPPTTITNVLSNALYAMEFHKHLAITNRSENYEFFQSVSHFTHDAATSKAAIVEAANKIYSLYVAEKAPLRVSLRDDICHSIKAAIDNGTANKQTFEAAHVHVLSLMETESLVPFLTSRLYSTVRERIADGEMETLFQEDIESTSDIMSKEFVEFLGDPDAKEVLSSNMGIDWFRQYLVIEFAEEGIDLWKATRDMLERSRLKVEDSRHAEEAHNIAEGKTPGSEGGSGGKQAETDGNDEATAGGDGEFDIRTEGRYIHERFIKSGCGAECNLPGRTVKKVSTVLEDEESSTEDIVHAFEQVEQEIFKLLAYDPFLRFKRSGLYTKYCMRARLRTQRSSLSLVSWYSQRELASDSTVPVD